MENETELTFLSWVRVNPEPGNDIVSVPESDPIGPVEWTDDEYGSLEKNKNNERSKEMLRMICKEFRMRETAIPTHFRFNEHGDPTDKDGTTHGYFNQSRFCTLIRDGYLKALTQDGCGCLNPLTCGDVIYGVVPTQKGRAFVKSH